MKGPGVLVVEVDKVVDGGDEVVDFGVTAALDLPGSEQGKPALDQIEPGGVSGGGSGGA